MDHSIYLIDWLRWTLQDEVVAITGMSRTLVHKDLDPQKEDFGVALIEFSRGAVATVEVTWSSPRGNGLTSWQFAGTDGNLVYDGSINPSIVVRSSHGNADATAWQTLVPDSHPVSGRTPHDGRGYAESSYRTSMSAGPLDHLLDCLADGTRPIATIDDSVLTLKACLAFYEASHTGTTVKL
jgi:predicted dehydrogenase